MQKKDRDTMKSKREDQDRRWREIEGEVGEPIRVHCLARYLDGTLGRPAEFWGLLFVTDRALYYRSMPAEGWQGRLRSFVGIGLETEEDSKQNRIGLSEITKVTIEKPRTLWRRIVTPYPKESITIRTSENWLILAPDMSVDELAEALVMEITSS